ncbi:MAG TPA: RDD family protein [Puia sp.]|nr:RDD family protein [Puia sp.]
MQIEQIPEDESIFEDYYERASTGKRLANYLIDLVLFYVLLFILGFVLALISPTFTEIVTSDRPGFGLLDRLITLLLYAVYMSVVEALFHGKSLGKLITKTKAVNDDGTQISTAKAFERGFSRAVPFCAFSAFGDPCNPWQDRWTGTMVINEKK